MMEFLPRTLLAVAAGFYGKLVVPPNQGSRNFIRESLELIRMPPERIVYYDGQPWWIEQLWVPRTFYGASTLSYFPGLIEMVRDALLRSTDGPMERRAGEST